MSTQRDELAQELFIVDNHKQSREQSVVDWEWFTETPKFGVRVENYKTTADGLIAAGYRKPRTITAVEELDSLPVGSVILCRKRAWTRFAPKQLAGALVEIHKWMCPDGGILRADSDQDIILPATVLYEPTP